jgi:hypothetical protein
MELERRNVLRLLGGAGLVTVVGACGASTKTASSTSTTTSSSTTTASGSSATTTAIPEETAGPYPGDGSNGPNVLADSAIVRADIRSSYGAYTGTAAGVPLTITLTVLDLASGAKPRQGAAVYLWHADRDGHYSLYSAPNQNYLRGVQETAADGTVTFQTIYPGCYDGRWPHIHFEVYESLGEGQRHEAEDVAGRDARGRMQGGLHRRRVLGERHEPLAHDARHRQRVRRRLVERARHRHRQHRQGLHRHPQRPHLTSLSRAGCSAPWRGRRLR